MGSYYVLPWYFEKNPTRMTKEGTRREVFEDEDEKGLGGHSIFFLLYCRSLWENSIYVLLRKTLCAFCLASFNFMPKEYIIILTPLFILYFFCLLLQVFVSLQWEKKSFDELVILLSCGFRSLFLYTKTKATLLTSNFCPVLWNARDFLKTFFSSRRLPAFRQAFVLLEQWHCVCRAASKKYFMKSL